MVVVAPSGPLSCHSCSSPVGLRPRLGNEARSAETRGRVNACNTDGLASKHCGLSPSLRTTRSLSSSGGNRTRIAASNPSRITSTRRLVLSNRTSTLPAPLDGLTLRREGAESFRRLWRRNRSVLDHLILENSHVSLFK